MSGLKDRNDAAALERVPLVSLALLVAVAAALFFTGLRESGFLDNEGRYAAVARAMLQSGDWITPRLNGEVFLNKPPLAFWLTAMGFRLTGLTEQARAVSGAAVILTIVLVFDLGRRISSPIAGGWAAAVFLTSALTTAEARVLRPDPLITLFLCLTLWGAVRTFDHRLGKDPAGNAWGPAAIWIGAALGIMAKGFLALALPLLALVPALLASGRWREARIYAPRWAVMLAIVIVLPWHLAAGVVNPGFWWDYVVNQHLLVFFDRKFPRDHIPHPLWFAWSILAARLMPWLFLLPAAIAMQWKTARQDRSVAAWLPLTWFFSIFLFFSLSSGRLEHYFIPAIPAASLLVGNLCARWCTEPQSTRWRAIVPFGILGALGIAGLVFAPVALSHTGVLQAVPELRNLALIAMGAVTLGGLAAALLAAARKLPAALSSVVLAFLVFAGTVARALCVVGPITSARSTIESVAPDLIASSEVAYEAGEEYQLCGVLGFYLGRRVVLPEPPGFIPPTYLRDYVRRLFVSREEFQTSWERGDRRYLLFTNPEKPVDRVVEFPHPAYVVVQTGGRAVITNLPLPPPAPDGSVSSTPN